MCFNRPRPIAWFWFLSAFTTCMLLGTWQVQRLHWKEGLITQLAAMKTEAPLTKLPKDAAAFKTLEFYPVKLSGTWRHDIEYHLYPRWYEGERGYSVIVPLQLTDGRMVLINRGWVPEKKKNIETRRETIAAGHGTVQGFLRVNDERNYFTPKNDLKDNIWFGRDIGQMAATYALKNVVPAMVDAVGTQDIARLPVPSDGTIRLRNDHLSYILTWYGIALGILVIFLVYHRKK